MRRAALLLAVALACAAPRRTAAAPSVSAPVALAGVVDGVVEDALGTPVEGAEVLAFAFGPPVATPLDTLPPWDAPPACFMHATEPSGRAVSGAKGRFSIEGIDPGVQVVLRASTKAGVSSSKTAWPGHPLGAGGTHLLLKPAHALAGRLVGPDGQPVAGWVRARGDRLDRGRWRSAPAGVGEAPFARADDQGRFRLGSLPEGDAWIDAFVPGRAAVFGVLAAVPSAEDVVVPIGAPDGAVVTGHVVATDGAPVAGARVTVLVGPSASSIIRFRGREELPEEEVWGEPEDPLSAGAAYAATTTVDGSYRVEHVAPGRVLGVAVDAPGRVPRREIGEGTSVVAGETLAFDVPTARGAVLDGTVVGDDGAPVAGAVVAVEVADAWGGRRIVVSDRDGRVRVEGLPLCPTSVEVGTADRECVSGWPAPGFLRKDIRAWIEGRSEGEVVAATFRLGRTVVVSGRVRDEEGRPLAGAVVAARDTERTRVGPGRRQVTRSDAEGRFAFAGLSPGSWSFEAGTRDGASAKTEVGLREGEGPFELDFVVRRFASIAGVAVSPDGQPLAHVVLSLDDAHRTAKADAAGRFSFDDVEPGAWAVVAEEAGYRGVDHNEASDFGEALPGQAIRDVRFQGPRRGTVEGVVVDQDGRAVPGVAVSLYRHGDQHFVDRWVGPEVFWGWTSVSDAHGRFRCEGVPEGNYSIRPQQATSSVEIEPGARDLRLVWYTDRLPGAHTRPPELMARVTDAAGRAVALASGGRREERSTVQTGAKFSVTGGVYRGRAWADVRRARVEIEQAFDASGRQVFLGKAASGDLTAGVEAVVRLPAVHAIEGRVVGEDGRPVAGVPVGLADVRGTRQDAFFGPWIDAVTDAQGRFVVPGVQADADPQATAVVAGPWLVKPADAGPAAKSVDVQLTRGAVVRGRVLGPDGAPWRGATVRFGARGSWRGDLTGPDGTFVLFGLPDGEQEVGIEFGRESGLERITRKVSGAAGPVEIRASRATARIEGELEIDDRTIFVMVAFRLFAADGPGADDPAAKPVWEEPRTSSSKRDRSFALGPVPPGRYRLVVEELEGPRRRAEVLVTAPSRGVHVVAGGPAGLDGTVTGEGAAGALVEAHWTADGSPRSAWTRADSRGRFSARVPIGVDLRVFARAGSRCGVVGPVRTGGADVSVVLAEGRVIEGKVVRPDPAPASILVSATDADGRVVFGAADATGRFRIEGLPEGRYRVAARGVLDKVIWSAATSDVAAGATTVEVKLEVEAR